MPLQPGRLNGVPIEKYKFCSASQFFRRTQTLSLCVLSTATIHSACPSLSNCTLHVKAAKHLSVICAYWHKPSVNKFLIPVWRRVAFGWSVQFADFFIAGNQLQQPDFHSAHTPCLGEAQLMLYMVTADFSFSKSVSSLSLHTSISSHPPPLRAFLHPVVLARSV